MSNRHLINLAHDLQPGLGVFGSHPPLRQTHEVNGRLGRIVVILDAGQDQSFTFPDIHLFNRMGRLIAKEKAIASVEVTSLHERHKGADLREMFIQGKQIQSGSEARPALTIRLQGGVDVSRIQLENRRGHMGRVARNICVQAYHNGRMVLRSRLNDPQLAVESFQALCQKLDLSAEDLAQSPGNLLEQVQSIRDAIVTGLDAEPHIFNIRELVQLLPVFAADKELTPFQLRIAAEVVIHILGDKLSAGIGAFDPLSLVLSSPRKLEAVIAEANRLLSRRHGRPVTVVASKHVFQEPKLVRYRDRFLTALDRIFPVLQECGVTPMLCYGSLLGAVRENAFMTHDDDIDILYYDGSRSREEMLAKRAILSAALTGHGYKSDLNDRIVNFHVRDENGALDLFPCWEEGKKLHVMMRYPVYLPIDRSIMLPTSQVMLHDRVYPAPADPRAFLAARYGRGWPTPDPYYEWPWPMDGTIRQKLTNAVQSPTLPSGVIRARRTLLDIWRRRSG